MHHKYKCSIPTKLSFVFILIVPMTQSSFWTVSWTKYFLKHFNSGCVNWLAVLWLFIFGVFPRIQILIFYISKSSQILWESLFRLLNKKGKSKKYLQYPSNLLEYIFFLLFHFEHKIVQQPLWASKPYKHSQHNCP